LEEVVGGKPNPYEEQRNMSNISRRSSNNSGLEEATVDLYVDL
jgi:hypothetical protein